MAGSYNQCSYHLYQKILHASTIAANRNRDYRETHLQYEGPCILYLTVLDLPRASPILRSKGSPHRQHEYVVLYLLLYKKHESHFKLPLRKKLLSLNLPTHQSHLYEPEVNQYS